MSMHTIRAGTRVFMACIVLLLTNGVRAGEPETPRFPRDLVLDPTASGPSWAATANEESASVTLVDLGSGEILDELRLARGGRPCSIDATITKEGTTLLAVAERFVHRVSILACDGKKLTNLRSVDTERLPSHVLFSSSGNTLFTACSSAGQVLDIDPRSGRVRRTIDAVEGVARLALRSKNGRAQLVASGRTGVAIIDLESGRRVAQREVLASQAFNLEALAVTGDRVFVGHQVKTSNVEIDSDAITWGLVIANRVCGISIRSGDESRAPVFGDSDADWIYPLDERFRANGDPSSIALVPTPKRQQEGLAVPQEPEAKQLMLVTAAGTGRLLFFDLLNTWPKPPEPLFTLDPAPELRLGGRPVAVKVSSDHARAYVVSYLDDSIHEVEIRTRTLLRTIRIGAVPLGTGASDDRIAGARIFFDAHRSHRGWYSCNSCHPDGGTSGHRFDTLSDRGGLAKKAPSLRGVSATGPWSWSGGFTSLEAQISASMHRTMASENVPRDEDVRRVAAYLRSLRQPRASRLSASEAAARERGEAIFEKAECGSCHKSPNWTSKGIKDVGVFDEYDGVREFNPPSLRGIVDDYRYLHDGRARSLRDVFAKHNVEKRHGKAASLSESELADLVVYLRSL